jgi:hypothetical protein
MKLAPIKVRHAKRVPTNSEGRCRCNRHAKYVPTTTKKRLPLKPGCGSLPRLDYNDQVD